MAAVAASTAANPHVLPMQRCVTDCAAFILLAFKAKRKIQKELPQEKGIILGQQPQMKKTTEPGALMPASESSFPPLESLLSKARLHEQHLFRAQHHARTSAKMMTITNKSTPPPPCTCSTVKTKIPAAELLSCPVDSPVAVVTSGESTATSLGPHMLPLATFTLRFTLLFKLLESQRRPRIAST